MPALEDARVAAGPAHTQFVRGASRTLLACGIALVWMGVVAADVQADSLLSEWRAETNLYLAGISRYRRSGNSTGNTQSLATTAELRFVPYARRWHTGLFADYQFTADSRFDNELNIGSFFQYSWNRWDATTFAFVNKTPGKPGAWFHAERLRYRIAENHRLGMEMSGAFSHWDTPAPQLGYYGAISDSISLNVIAGPFGDGAQQLSARIELVWQIL